MDNRYKELAKVDIAEERKAVISESSKGGYTIAQQIVAEEGKTSVFLKGSFHVSSVDGLYNLRDGLNAAIEKIENPPVQEDDEDWDYK